MTRNKPKLLRFIFTEYANGTDKKEIAEELNKRHILYKGKPFTFRTFENWLSNAKYTGEFMHEQRTGDNGMKSIEVQIRHAQDEAEQLTNAFILARNDLLRANIERKMQEVEILIKDLTAHKAQIELERGQKITKGKIIDFILILQ